jgi:hypothetical protein
MFLDMLYQHEKKVFKENKLDWILSLLQPYCISNSFPLDGLRVQFKMYSRLCPWLLTWSELEEDFDEDGDGYDDAGAN